MKSTKNTGKKHSKKGRAFSPVEIIQEVNEDVNSSNQSACMMVRPKREHLRPSMSQAILLLISQSESAFNGSQNDKRESDKGVKEQPFNSKLISFIKCLADLMTTRETIMVLRSLSTHFSRAMRAYLPGRL